MNCHLKSNDCLAIEPWEPQGHDLSFNKTPDHHLRDKLPGRPLEWNHLPQSFDSLTRAFREA